MHFASTPPSHLPTLFDIDGDELMCCAHEFVRGMNSTGIPLLAAGGVGSDGVGLRVLSRMGLCVEFCATLSTCMHLHSSWSVLIKLLTGWLGLS